MEQLRAMIQAITLWLKCRSAALGVSAHSLLHRTHEERDLREKKEPLVEGP